MSNPKPRRWWLACLLGLLAIGPESIEGQQKTVQWVPATSMSDPRIEVYRQAGTLWERRMGPAREVVDQVCLVPDLPTFFQAIATWDEKHYFPILIDDVESSFRFIRAFKPARIIRMPKAAEPIPADQTWDRAIEAVGASWASESLPASERHRGDEIPKFLGAIPPSAVFSSPDAPMLAGAVALAAGRFQPLFRLDYPKKFSDVLTTQEADAFSEALTAKLKEKMFKIDVVNDDCDFLTVAGDWPYGYREEGQGYSLDDRLGRQTTNAPHRWAWAGRLLGDSKDSVYRAMCSLFLQPESAIMFNGYELSSAPWSDYSMKFAATKLNAVVRTSQISGDNAATLEGWHETFDPMNRFGLVMINSHGSPTAFNIRKGAGSTSDIPFSMPAAVLIIHSYSATKPNDPSTIAGRWLANGAYIYFGSMNEPFLQAFRVPNLVGEMISEHMPLVVAVRATMQENYGQPWRLVFFGDPLYRLKTSVEIKAPRLASWLLTASWPAYTEPSRPTNGTDADLFLWSFKTALARLQGKPAKGTGGEDLIEALLSIKRSKLPADFRPIDDALSIDILLEARRRGALESRLMAIPPAERTPEVKRCIETMKAIDFNLAIVRGDATAIRAAWREVMKLEGADELKKLSTHRVGDAADTPVRRHDWLNLLRASLRDRAKSPDAEFLTAEIRRMEEYLKGDR